MRKALFAVVLVASSFAGGAVINGPGLRWVQAMVLNRDGEAEIATVVDPALPKDGENGSLEPIPSTPVPPLVIDSAASGLPRAKGKPTKAPAAAAAPITTAPTTTVTASAPEPKAPEPPDSKAPEPLEPKEIELGPELAVVKPPNDAQAALAKASADEIPLPLDPRAEPTPPKRQAEGAENAPWADAPGSAPAAAVPPRPFEDEAKAGTATASAPPPSPSPAAGALAAGAGVVDAPGAQPPAAWAEIRRKMTALGVSRYGIEGEPGGRVRFHCVIPLAGQRAVAQQFEAEGDDEWQAADLALRRVALWRATESAAP